MKFTVLPKPFVTFAANIDELALSGPFSIDPITYIVIPVGIYEPSIAVIYIVLELAFVDDVVNFFSDTTYSSILINLPNDKFIVF